MKGNSVTSVRKSLIIKSIDQGATIQEINRVSRHKDGPSTMAVHYDMNLNDTVMDTLTANHITNIQDGVHHRNEDEEQMCSLLQAMRQTELKERIANFGLVHIYMKNVIKPRLYNGKQGNYLFQQQHVDSIIDCEIKITSLTSRKDCECSPVADKTSFNSDPRTDQIGLCYQQPFECDDIKEATSPSVCIYLEPTDETYNSDKKTVKCRLSYLEITLQTDCQSFLIVLLAFGLAVLSTIVPPQSNDSVSFPLYTFENGKLKLPGSWYIVTLRELTDEKLRFKPDTNGNLNLLPDLTILPWKESAVFETGTVGAKQYVNKGFYDFQAIVLYLYKKQTIVPSYLSLYECQPRIETVSIELFNEDGTVKDWTKMTFLAGVIDEACYGTEASENRTCRTECTTSEVGTFAENKYGKDFWLTNGGTMGRDALKLRIANFGPVLDIHDDRLYYGWEGYDFFYIQRENGVLKSKVNTMNQTAPIYEYIVAHQYITCTDDIQRNTSADLCPCPDPEDTEAYDSDPRFSEGGICYIAPPHVPVDCEHDLAYDTPEEDCPCPDKEDKEAYESDPRAQYRGICGSGIYFTEIFEQQYIEGDSLKYGGEELEVELIPGTERFKADEFGNLDMIKPLDDFSNLNWVNSDVYGTEQMGPMQYVDQMFYDFQASVLYAYNSTNNIKPSYWYIRNCHPTKSQYGNIFAESGQVPSWEYITFIRGVVPEECYGTEDLRACPVMCPNSPQETVYSTSRGQGIFIKFRTLDPDELKVRLQFFGPVLADSPGVTGPRVYYGFEGENLLYFYRENGVLKKDKTNFSGHFARSLFTLRPIDCFSQITSATRRYQCECPPAADSTSFNADPRSQNEYGLCYKDPKSNPIDCETEATLQTTEEECPCPVPSVKALTYDPRFAKGGACNKFVCDVITEITSKTDCACPSKDDKEEYDADPRTVKGGICDDEPLPDDPETEKDASGSIRALWSVISAVMLIPLMSMW
ncbi:MAG: hypothetical protein EZS28_002126 [Streblomastix strix]|uniref:Uncharacterized protein n=1 Tax=Streblomastix strix TaxID=222440 RepID=A0A5J4X6R7_9EUKA|nr:MAG: hypothetical protein EZS28_002126 [Streblomastix strix]